METERIVLIHDNKIIPAYYSASAGGHTKDASQVWTKNLDFIKAVPSFDEGIKKNGHGVGMSQYGADYMARQGSTWEEILKHYYSGVEIA